MEKVSAFIAGITIAGLIPILTHASENTSIVLGFVCTSVALFCIDR